MGEEAAKVLAAARSGLPLAGLGEELPGGRVKCRRCGKWCASWLGLAVHCGKAHGKRCATGPAPAGPESGVDRMSNGWPGRAGEAVEP